MSLAPLASINLIVQWVGILVVVGLLLLLTQSIRRPSLDDWAAAWCCLALGLALLYLDISRPAAHHPLRAGYFLAEYGFGFLLVAGCRHLARGTGLSAKDLRWLPAGIAAALLVLFVSPDFNVEFALHAAILAGFFLAAFLALRPARRLHGGPGATVMSAALLLLALDFCHYVPVFLLAARRGDERRFAYLDFTSSVDLILETVLAFGIVMLTMESLRRDSERANRELEEALGHLEILARTDSLTDALNRHAYHGLFAGQHGTAPVHAGCVALADVNRLKVINDRNGHSSGDRAIRQVATAIRSVIRADDLLFRWGGDEFLVILGNVGEDEARRRFEAVNAFLAQAEPREGKGGEPRQGDGPGEPHLSVAFGIAPFAAATAIDEAIAQADRQMYARKRGRGRAG